MLHDDFNQYSHDKYVMFQNWAELDTELNIKRTLLQLKDNRKHLRFSFHLDTLQNIDVE